MINFHTQRDCPLCGVPWRHKENIFEHFLSKGKHVEEAKEIASHYGHTQESPKYFGTQYLVGQYSRELDRTVAWVCTGCTTVWDRNTGEVINAPST